MGRRQSQGHRSPRKNVLNNAAGGTWGRVLERGWRDVFERCQTVVSERCCGHPEISMAGMRRQGDEHWDGGYVDVDESCGSARIQWGFNSVG
jgi:hypothetical protein